MVFNLLGGIAKATLGIVFSPVSIAADIMTLGGTLTDRDEPYTVDSMRAVMRNLELAFDPDELTDNQVRRVIQEIERRR